MESPPPMSVTDQALDEKDFLQLVCEITGTVISSQTSVILGTKQSCMLSLNYKRVTVTNEIGR